MRRWCYLGKDSGLDLLTFDYEEARKPGKTEAPAEFVEGGHPLVAAWQGRAVL